MTEKKLATVTVTYNRKELLLKNIKAIVSQSYNIDCIIIVDNHSTDNTKEAVMEKFPNNNIKYIYLDENIGGAGGFYTGCKYAYDNGYDWIVLMDDDGRPKNNDTIGNLMKEIQRKHLNENDKIMINSLVLCDEINLSFKMFSQQDTIENIKAKSENGVILNNISPFNGTLISKGLIQEIGFPNKELFISYDEKDYNYRAKKADAYIATVIDSLYSHPANYMKNARKVNIFGKRVIFYISSPWKLYYSTRNATFVYKDNKKKVFRYIITRFISIWVVKCKKIECIKMMIKGYKDGKKGRLGKTIEPI